MMKPTALPKDKRAARKRLLNAIAAHRAYYLLMLPALVYVLVFNYAPLYGLQIAFKNYKGYLGIINSPWVGLDHFETFFSGVYFGRLMRNTLILSLYSLFASFPLPIILALLLNEVNERFGKITKTILYAPHFISTVVLVGIINTMFSPSIGVVNKIIEMLGGESIYFLGDPGVFRHLYVWSGIWQGTGWSAVIYIAALAGVSPELHEAATIDGANRLQRIWYINIPCIMPTIIILFIMSMGQLVSIGYEKVYLLQNSLNQEVSEVISTYVYKHGIIKPNYSYTAAIDLFNNVINLVMLCLANGISRKLSDTSLF